MAIRASGIASCRSFASELGAAVCLPTCSPEESLEVLDGRELEPRPLNYAP